jgi:predicted CopG family antitoxin
MVSKTVSIDLDDLKRVQNKIKEGKAITFSEFVQRAIKNELKR